MLTQRHCLAALCAGFALLASGCASSMAAHRAAKRLPLSPCTVPGVKHKLLCGTYAVWENRAAGSGRKIPLHIVVVPALARHPAPDPIFSFAGGPGDAATKAAADWAQDTSLRTDRDIVLIDQRGTGESNRLQCTIPEDKGDIQGYFEPSLPRPKVEECATKLEEKADLSQYTTTISAADLDEVRAFLGYERINLEGGSYGTRMAQVYLRLYPERVRSATLVGLVGMNQRLPLMHARDGKRSVDLLVRACLADAACRGAYPQLEEELAEVYARLAREPIAARVESPISGERVEVRVERAIFAEQMRFMHYTAWISSLVPYVIHRAFEGDFEPYARIALAWELAFREILSYGMHLSVTCAEDLPFITNEEIAPAVAGTYLGDYRVASQKVACEVWPRGEAPADFHEHVVSNVPVLILSGELDPVTPPSWAAEAVRHFSRGRHVVLPEGHHGPGGLTNRACFDGLVAEFVRRADAQGLDTTCIETMKRPPFVLDQAGFDNMARALEE